MGGRRRRLAPWTGVLLPALVLAAALTTGLSAAVRPGGLDPSFGTRGRVLTNQSGGIDVISAAAVQQDGKVVVSGGVNHGGAVAYVLARYNVNGTLDTRFGYRGWAVAPVAGSALAIQRDGRILVGGVVRDAQGATFGVARLRRDGTRDQAFGSGGVARTTFSGLQGDLHNVNAVAVQPDGKIVAAGAAFVDRTVDGGDRKDFALVRFRRDGSLDPAFGDGGRVVTGFGRGMADVATEIALDRRGRIVVAGVSDRLPGNANRAVLVAARYDNRGQLDTTYGTRGQLVTRFDNRHRVHPVAVQPDGAIVAAGREERASRPAGLTVVRYTTRGRLDSTFGRAGIVVSTFGGGWHASPTTGAIDSRGRVIVAGERRRSAPGASDFAVARYSRRGAPDRAFGVRGVAIVDFGGRREDAVSDVALLRDGRIVVAGSSSYPGPGNSGDRRSDFALARLLSR